MEVSGLKGLAFEGHQSTWERGRGTTRWVEDKFDRILVSDNWLDLFDNVKASSIDVPSSDHLPLVLWPNPTVRLRRRRKFKFEKFWLKEKHCREIVFCSWEQSSGLSLTNRLERCIKAIWNWGKGLTRNFQPKVDFYKMQMEKLRDRADYHGILAYVEARRHYLGILNQQNTYWKQRAKVFWYKEGDSNSKFFHNFVRNRRRNNNTDKLRDNEGDWKHKGPDLHSLMM